MPPIQESYSALQMKPRERRLLLSIRYIKYVVAWLAIWQDSQVDGSIFQIYEYTGRFHSVHPYEVLLIALAIIFFIERTITPDFTIKRSYFSAPVLMILLGLFISWVRGSWINQSFGIVYEVHEAFELPFVFFLLLNMFREVEERRILIVLIVTATVMKALDGAWIKFFSTDEARLWGVLQMWRDGFLLATGVAGAMILLHYKGVRYRWLKRLMLASTPLILFTTIVSFRRAFFLAILASSFVMLLTVGKGRRKKQFWLLLILLVGLATTIMLTDPTGFLLRLVGAFVDPSSEGSAAIRLMELPNVWMNIVHNPIWGTPIGTLWHIYYPMPLFANYVQTGTHNTYLYWPLRTGIIGSVGFYWMLARIWKALIINSKLAKTEEDYFYTQVSIHMMVIYHVGAMFGILYGDAMTLMTALLLVTFQLQTEFATGLTSIKEVNLWQTIRQNKLVMRARPSYALRAKFSASSLLS